MQKSRNTNVQITDEALAFAKPILAPVLIDWIVEYKEYWYDCCTEYEECTLNVKASTKKEAEKIGRKMLIEMDEKDNKHFDMVSRSFRLVCEQEYFTYDSSRKEPLLNGFQGHIDVTKWNGL